MVTPLNWTPVFESYMAKACVKNTHQKKTLVTTTRFDDYSAHNIDIYLSGFDVSHNREGTQCSLEEKSCILNADSKTWNDKPS